MIEGRLERVEALLSSAVALGAERTRERDELRLRCAELERAVVALRVACSTVKEKCTHHLCWRESGSGKVSHDHHCEFGKLLSATAVVALRDAPINRDHLAAALAYAGDVPPDDVWWRWQATIRNAEAGHSGDCTKQPWSCALCQRDQHLADADDVLAVLKHLAAVLVPEPEQPKEQP